MQKIVDGLHFSIFRKKSVARIMLSVFQLNAFDLETKPAADIYEVLENFYKQFIYCFPI